MNIDIQGIVDNKIQALHNSGTIKQAIETSIEKTVLKAITDALEDYSFRHNIEKQISAQVSEVVNDIGFTAYNSFIADKVKQITEGVCRADIAEKIQATFDQMLIVKRDNIKLSEIFKKYREWACEEVETQDQYSLEHFYVKFQQDEKYGWYNVELALEDLKDKYSSYRSEPAIRFTLHQNKLNPGTGWIGSTYLDGYDIKKKFDFGHRTDMEALIINLAYNQTPIIIDVESEDDIDNSYDVDI